MKKLEDDELQTFIEAMRREKNQSFEPEGDGRLYQMLFDCLEKNTVQALPAGFSARVVKRIARRKYIQQLARDYIALLLIMAVALGIGLTTITLLEAKAIRFVLAVLADLRGPIVFVVVILTIIEAADKWLRFKSGYMKQAFR